VLLALLVRVGAAWQTAAIFNDGPSFLGVAALFYEGRVAEALGHHYHPLYPLAIALMAPLTGDFARAGVAVSCLAGSLAVLGLFSFLSRAYGRHVAVVGGVLFACHPYAARFSADVQSEGLYFALFLAAVALSFRGVSEESWRHSFAAGAASGGAYLVRPEGLGVAVAALALGALLLFQGRMRVGAFARVSAGLILGLLLVAAPYVVHLHGVTGDWILTQKKSVADLVTPPEPAWIAPDGVPDRERFRSPPLRRPIPRQAGLLPARIDFEPRAAAALVDLLVVCLGALHPLIALLVLLGITSVRGPPSPRGLFLGLLVLLYGVVLYGLAFGVGYLDRRHVLAPLLPLLGLAALGVPVAARSLLRVLRVRADAAVATRAALAIVVLALISKTWAPHREERLANRHAAEWLAQQEHLHGAVAAEKHRTAWYAREAFVRVGRGDGDVAGLARAGARFLVIDDVQLRARGETAASRASLNELHRVEAAGRTAFVYDLSDLEAPSSDSDRIRSSTAL